jgi:hypothetical protein
MDAAAAAPHGEPAETALSSNLGLARQKRSFDCVRLQRKALRVVTVAALAQDDVVSRRRTILTIREHPPDTCALDYPTPAHDHRSVARVDPNAADGVE